MKRYQLSSCLQKWTDPESGLTMIFHSLFGHPLVVNEEGLRFLELFQQPVTKAEAVSACEGDPSSLIENLVALRLVTESSFDERGFLREQQEEHLRRVLGKLTFDRMGLAISDRCNLSCEHCIHFQRASKDHQPSADRPLLMSWDTAKRCVDRFVSAMKDRDCHIGKIHFGNAEPLMNWPVLRRVLEYCGAREDFRFQFAINTNLLLLTEEMAEIFKKYRVAIATSLDGTRQANDLIRQTRLGGGTYENILAKFNLLARIGYPLDGFSITVNGANFALVNTDIIDLAAERGMINLAFDYDLVGLVNIPIEERVEKLIRLRRYAKDRGIDFYGTWDSPFHNLTADDLPLNEQFFCAAVAGRSIEFNVDGGIKVCGHTNTLVGDLDSFDKMFSESGGLYRMVKERLPGAKPDCVGCPIEGQCGGQCHVTREVVARMESARSARLFQDMCDFYRAVTKAMAFEYLKSPESHSTQLRQTCSL